MRVGLASPYKIKLFIACQCPRLMSGSLVARVPDSDSVAFDFAFAFPAAGNLSEFSCSETQDFPEQL